MDGTTDASVIFRRVHEAADEIEYLRRRIAVAALATVEAVSGEIDRGEVIERVRRYLRDCGVRWDMELAEWVVEVVLVELLRQDEERVRIGEPDCGVW